jgi:hypothetical protein
VKSRLVILHIADVFLDAVLGPFGVENELFSLFLGAGDRDEVRAATAAALDLAGDSLVSEFKVALGRREGRVEDGVLDQGIGHRLTLDDRRERRASPAKRM